MIALCVWPVNSIRSRRRQAAVAFTYLGVRSEWIFSKRTDHRGQIPG